MDPTDDEEDTPAGSVTISEATIDGATLPVLAFTGDLDISSAQGLRRTAREVLPRVPEAGLVIDLTATTFADSRGIAEILGVRRMLDGRPVLLRGVNERLERTLQIMALDQLFERAPDGAT